MFLFPLQFNRGSLLAQFIPVLMRFPDKGQYPMLSSGLVFLLVLDLTKIKENRIIFNQAGME